MRRSYVLIAVSAASIAATPLAAQTCLGAPSFADAPWAAVGAITSGNNASELGATLRYGKPMGMFFGGTLSRVDFDGTDENSVAVGLQIGHELHQAARPNISICPMGSIARGYGPDFGATEVSTIMLTGGVTAGGTIAVGEDVVGAPFVGAHFVHLRGTLETAGIDNTDTENYLTLNGGFGFVISRTFGITPSVSIPFGLEGADPTFTLSVQYNFGRK